MVAAPEIGFLAIVVIALFVIYRVVKAIKPLVINTVVGLLILGLASVVGFGVQITPVVMLIVAFGGIPAAIVVIALAQLGIVFDPALVVPF
ncbi:MAG: pro-sigmaK processing inhibitor BofA family protein [Halobacteriales archaeon]|nr:pro-sigmaK processing inhibitor BofA family protein [Halobacteriales archaeon]